MSRYIAELPTILKGGWLLIIPAGFFNFQTPDLPVPRISLKALTSVFFDEIGRFSGVFRTSSKLNLCKYSSVVLGLLWRKMS
jgi:hypothetical protein